MLNRDEEALDRLGLALEKWPESVELWHLRAAILLKLDRCAEARIAYEDLIRLAPTMAEAYSGRGLLLRKMSQPKEALEDFIRAIEIKPSLIAAFEEKSELSAQLGMGQQATKDKTAAKEAHRKRALELAQAGDFSFLAQLNRALELDPDYFDALKDRALVHIRFEQFGEAEKDILHALKLRPTEVDVWMLLFIVKQQTGQLAAALLEAVQANPHSPQLFCEYIKHLISQEKYVNALQLLLEFENLHPPSVPLSNLKVRIFMLEGKVEEAGRLVAKLKDVKQEDETVYEMYAEVFKIIGDIQSALECFDLALKLNPNTALIVFKKAVLLLANPEVSGLASLSPAEATIFKKQRLADIDRAIALDSSVADFYHGKAQFLLQENRLDEALEVVGKGLLVDPEEVTLHCLKAQVLMNTKKIEEGLQVVDMALGMNLRCVELYTMRGYLLIGLNRLGEALKDLTTIQIDQLPEEQIIPIKMGIAIASSRLGNDEEALETLAHIHALKPNICEVHILRSSCYLSLGRYKEAMQAISEALLINPDNFEARIHKAACERCLGQTEKAIESIDACIMQDPKEIESRKIKAEILAG